MRRQKVGQVRLSEGDGTLQLAEPLAGGNHNPTIRPFLWRDIMREISSAGDLVADHEHGADQGTHVRNELLVGTWFRGMEHSIDQMA